MIKHDSFSFSNFTIQSNENNHSNHSVFGLNWWFFLWTSVVLWRFCYGVMQQNFSICIEWMVVLCSGWVYGSLSR